MFRRAYHLPVLLGGLYLLGCQNTTEPSAGQPGGLVQFAKSATNRISSGTGGETTLTVATPVLAVCPRAGYDSTAAAIGTAGGTLKVGKHVFAIPAGALSSTVKISMVIPGDSTASVRFRPEGLNFNWLKLPVLTLSYSGCKTSSNPSVVYISESFNLLEWLSTLFLDPKNGTVQSYVSHFSRYAVAW